MASMKVSTSTVHGEQKPALSESSLIKTMARRPSPTSASTLCFHKSGHSGVMRKISGFKKPLTHTNSLSKLPKYGVETADEDKLGTLLDDVNKWGIDIFQVAAYSNSRPLTVMMYTIFRVSKPHSVRAFDAFNATFISVERLVEGISNIIGNVSELYDDNRRLLPQRSLSQQHTCGRRGSISPRLAFVSGSRCELEENRNSLRLSTDNYHLSQLTNVFLNFLQSVFTELEILTALFAAAIHDVDHPGLTNQYLVNASDELAVLYNDESVLENHSLAVAFKVLQDDACNILANLNKKQTQTMRKMAIDMVLATDMSKHMSLLADLKTMVETKKVAGSGVILLDNYTERIQILQNMLHCADLGNPTKPLEIYKKWVELVMEEFFQQGDKERSLGMDISPMCDRFNARIEKSQVMFTIQLLCCFSNISRNSLSLTLAPHLYSCECTNKNKCDLLCDAVY